MLSQAAIAFWVWMVSCGNDWWSCCCNFFFCLMGFLIYSCWLLIFYYCYVCCYFGSLADDFMDKEIGLKIQGLSLFLLVSRRRLRSCCLIFLSPFCCCLNACCCWWFLSRGLIFAAVTWPNFWDVVWMIIDDNGSCWFFWIVKIGYRWIGWSWFMGGWGFDLNFLSPFWCSGNCCCGMGNVSWFMVFSCYLLLFGCYCCLMMICRRLISQKVGILKDGNFMFLDKSFVPKMEVALLWLFSVTLYLLMGLLLSANI